MAGQPVGFTRASSKLWILLLIIGLVAVVPRPSFAQDDESGTLISASIDNGEKTEVTVASSTGGETPVDDEELPVDDPPQIYSHMELVLQIGENISIGCEGPREIVWDYTERSESDGVVDSGPIKFSSSSKLYYRELRIERATWKLTGSYRCRYKDISKWASPTTTTALPVPNPYGNGGFGDLNVFARPRLGGHFNPAAMGKVGFGASGQDPASAGDKLNDVQEGDGVWASKVFIFVSDPQRPFQYETESTLFYFVVYYHPFFIQCGVTDPSFRTELIFNVKNATGDSGTIWDPRTGFLIQLPTFQVVSYPKCVVYNDVYPQGYAKHLHIIPGNQIDKPPQPYTIASKKSLMAGDTLTITCQVKVGPNDMIFLYLNYPLRDQKLARYDEEVPLRVPEKGYDVITKKLTVSNVQVQDSGAFKCRTTTDKDDAYSHRTYAESSIEITVYQSTFVNVTVPHTVLNAMDTDEGSTMKAYVNAVPKPKIEWLFEGENLEKNPSFMQIYHQKRHESKLLVKKPKTEYSGIYTIKATIEVDNITKEASKTIAFYVQGQPDVHVEAISDSDDNVPAKIITVREPSSHTFKLPITCKVRGYPHSEITWFYQPCMQAYCERSNNESAWEEIPESSTHRRQRSISLGMVEDVLYLDQRKNGHYKCEAQNSYGNSSDSLLVLITGETGIQSVRDSIDRAVVRGDSITVTCAANKWLYSSVALKRKSEEDLTDIVVLPGTTDSDMDDKNRNETPRGKENKTTIVANKGGIDGNIRAPMSYSHRDADEESDSDTAASGTTTPSLTDDGVGFAGGINKSYPTTTTSYVPVKERPKQHFSESENMIEVSLTWDKLKNSDQGEYICEANSAAKNETHKKTYRLILHDIKPPDISVQSGSSRRVSIGSSALFQCVMRGLPPPIISWYKAGDLLNVTELDRYVLTSQGSSLTIKNTTLADEGNYQCMGINYGGKVWSTNMTLLVGEAPVKAGSSNYYIGIIIGIVVFIIILVIIIVKIKFSKTASHKDLEQFLIQPQGDYNPDLPIDEQTGCLPYDAKWEFPKDRLRLGMILGQGAFGRVMKAEAIGITDGEDVTVVAVKMVKDCTDKDQMMALLSELKILIHIGQHLNILNLLGAVTKDIRFGELYVIVEYCHFGNLRSYLIKNKEYFQDTMEDLDEHATGGADSSKFPPPYDSAPMTPSSPTGSEKPMHEKGPYYVNKAGGPHGSAALFGPSLTTKNLFCWAFQVARGMEFLAARKYIHRDLAARNVLLSEDNIVKICDFGLAKDLYQDQEYFKKGDGPVPVKWMALESFTHRIYTTKSDVWSYGILLWELFSLGGNPYPGVEINEKFIGLLKSGYRMERPPFATDELYKLMLQMWKVEPDDRPSFSSLVASMGDFLESNVKQYYLDLSSPYMKMQGDGEGGSMDEAGEQNGESNILTDPDGYLKMSPTLGPDYSNILPNSPKAATFAQIDETTPTYVNQRRWKKEDETDEMEMAPLTGRTDDRKSSMPDAIAPGFMPEEDNQIHTVAEVHQLEETDSGHSSSYEGAGLSPVIAVENNDYLTPVLPDSPPPSPPIVSSHQPQQKAEIVPPVPAPPEGPKISLAAKLPPLRQAPSSNASRLRQPTPLRLYPITSTTAPSSMFQAAASTAPLTRSVPIGSNKKNQEFGASSNGSAVPDHRKRGSDGFVPKSMSPSTTPTESELPSNGRPILGSLLKLNGGGAASLTSPTSSSNLTWGNKRAGIPKMKDTSRVYTPAGGATDSGANSSSPVSTTPSSTSLVAPTISNPVSKYTAWPLPPPDSPVHDAAFEGNGTVTNPSHPLLNGPLRTRIGHFRNGLNEGRFLSNASSGYNSDLSPAESTPPPDYRAVLEDATETDILV